MKMQKNVLRAAACAAVSAVMAAMILTACGGSSGAPSSSGSNGTGNGGAASSTPTSSSSSTGSSTASGSASGTTAAKATKILQYVNGTVQAEYTSQKDGSSIVNHYLCAVSGENVYVLTYDSSDKASTAFVQKDGAIYAIDGKYMSKAPSASGMIRSAKTGCNFPTTAEAATMTTGKYTVNGREYDAEILKKSVYDHPVSYIYCFEGNVLKYRVVSGLYYDTSKNPINEVTTYKSISTKVDAKLFDLSNYSLMP